VNGSNTVRVIAGIVLALVVAAIGVGAYQIGVQAGVAQTGATAAPAAVPYYYGWHPFGFGFGFLGFLGTLLFIFLIFALIRALVFGGRGRGWGGGPGRWANHDHGWRGGPWESRPRETFEDWHREAHQGGGDRGGPDTVGDAGGGANNPNRT
jgi:hypothetical protein